MGDLLEEKGREYKWDIVGRFWDMCGNMRELLELYNPINCKHPIKKMKLGIRLAIGRHTIISILFGFGMVCSWVCLALKNMFFLCRILSWSRTGRPGPWENKFGKFGTPMVPFPPQVVSEMHRALSEQLANMDQRMIHIEEHTTASRAKRLSIASEGSQRSQKLKASNSGKRLQAATGVREICFDVSSAADKADQQKELETSINHSMEHGNMDRVPKFQTNLPSCAGRCATI